MQDSDQPKSTSVSRRHFLERSSLVAAGASILASAGCSTAPAKWTPPHPVTVKKKEPVRAIVIGLGGRGSGAGGNFLEAAKMLGVDAKVVAVADIFPEAAAKGRKLFGVPEDKCFSGFDAYVKALEVPGVNYAILATPPGFRPHHFKACVAAGKNIFMEKPVAVDGPGIRIVYAAYEEAKKKNLKVAAGTQRRHRPSYIETIKRLQDGAIGDIVSLRGYWVNSGPIWHRGEHGDTDLERQIRNWYHYVWLCGDHICEQHVHNIDVCNWIAGSHPVKAWGMGSRQQLGKKSGEIWDNFAIEYQYANGMRFHAHCSQITREWSSVSEAAHGATGMAEFFDGKNIIKMKNGKTWKPGPLKEDNGYVLEHRDLIAAIMNDTPLNEAKQVADSTLTAILGREAAYSGEAIEWDAMLNNNFKYGPEQLYADASKMTWGAFRTLKPPMPSEHNLFSKPPAVPVA